MANTAYFSSDRIDCCDCYACNNVTGPTGKNQCRCIGRKKGHRDIVAVVDFERCNVVPG